MTIKNGALAKISFIHFILLNLMFVVKARLWGIDITLRLLGWFRVGCTFI